MRISEPARETEVIAEYDVIVAGGGVAGMAAAIAAARQGCSVCVIEKACMLGGLATLGLISIYLPLCDGRGRQVMFGLAEELLRLSIRHGVEKDYPKAWLEGGTQEERTRHRFLVQYNPALFAMEVEQMLLDLGVRIHYDMRICAVVKDGGGISAVILEGKQGRQAIACKIVVDCTGDADVCAYAGAPTARYRENRLAMWYYWAGDKGYKLSGLATPLYGQLPAGERYYDGLNQDDVDAVITEGRKRILADLLKKREESNDPSLFPVNVPQVPSFRMTRRLIGAYELDESEQFTHFGDSIGMAGDWRKAGPIFEIPYRCLYSAQVPNLAVAGRCISVTTAMWDITRVIPVCALTGEAAGTAAALCVRQGMCLPQLPVPDLAGALQAQGVQLQI